MFEKLYKRIQSIEDFITKSDSYNKGEVLKVQNSIFDIKHKLGGMAELQQMARTIKSQQRTIEQLTNALRDKYEHGLFIVSEDCKIPLVIRNGKEITNEMTSRFRIDWTFNEFPMIEIEQFVGTDSSDVEE